MPTMRTMPTVVAYKTFAWIESCIRGFREHVPDLPLLVVDNNPLPDQPAWDPGVDMERAWLEGQPDLHLTRPLHPCPDPDSPPASHGHALDHATQWCREHDIDIMVLFEPDCIITGRAWIDALIAAIEDGAWMAGPLGTGFGPIKPCPSAWRVDEIAGTFAPVPVPHDHPRYAELVDASMMRRSVGEELWHEFWCERWDTGFGNWFHAALAGRTRHLTPERGPAVTLTAEIEWNGLRHVGGGSTRNRSGPAGGSWPR